MLLIKVLTMKVKKNFYRLLYALFRFVKLQCETYAYIFYCSNNEMLV